MIWIACADRGPEDEGLYMTVDEFDSSSYEVRYWGDVDGNGPRWSFDQHERDEHGAPCVEITHWSELQPMPGEAPK